MKFRSLEDCRKIQQQEHLQAANLTRSTGIPLTAARGSPRIEVQGIEQMCFRKPRWNTCTHRN
jgi:hypothetical protein